MCTNGLAQLVSKHESRLVSHVQIATQLQLGDTLSGIHEDRDRQQIIANRQFAAGENRTGCDAELIPAIAALPEAPVGNRIVGGAVAARALRLAIVIGPPDCLEGGAGLILAHPGNRRQAQGAGLGGQEEVLGHLGGSNVIRWYHLYPLFWVMATKIVGVG